MEQASWEPNLMEYIPATQVFHNFLCFEDWLNVMCADI